MGIPLSAGFDVGTDLPLDARLVKADVTARNAIDAVSRYEGMPTYVVATGKNYQLRGGIADANWVELIDTGEPALGNPATNGYVLSSTTAGVRSWVAPSSGMTYPGAGIANSTGSAWGTSYTTTGTGTVVALQASPNFTSQITITHALYPYISMMSTAWGSAVAMQIGVTWDGNSEGNFWAFESLASKGFSFTNGSTSRFLINTDGNVGIGTTVPLSKLQITGSLTELTTENELILARDYRYGTSYAAVASIAIGSKSSGVVNTQLDFKLLNGNYDHIVAPDTTVMTLLSNGNVGIGTTTPGVKFVVSGATLANTPTLGSATVGANAILSANGLYGLYTGISSNGDAWQQVQRNDGNTESYNLFLQPGGGKVGIGNTSPAGILDVRRNYSANNDTDGASIYLYAQKGGVFVNRSPNGGNIILMPGERGYTGDSVTKNGRVGIGIDTPSSTLHVVGIVLIGQNTNGTASIDAYNGFAYFGCNTASNGIGINSSGAITITSTATATNFILSSDERLKTKISSFIPYQVRLQYHKYELRSEPGITRYGFIAQEVQKDYPEFVREDAGGILSVSYTDILIRKIAYLEWKVEQLEKKLN